MENNSDTHKCLSNDRLHYLDVAKGILIIMVVYSHIQWLSSTTVGITSPEWDLLNKIGFYLWVPFYMACFFSITGYCTNFNKNFKSFLSSKILTLLFPMFVLLFTIHWFICALFNSLLLYYFIKKHINNTLVLILIMLGGSVIGSIFTSIEPLISIKRYYIFHTIGLVGFICFGQLIRIYSKYLLNKKVIISCFVIYITLVISAYVKNITLPGIYSKYDVTISQWPLHIILSITGIISLLGISKFINKNKPLEYWDVIH